MDNLTMLNLIIGFLSPAVVSLITQPGFDTRLRVGVMAGVSLIAGFLTSYFDGSFNPTDVTSSVLIVAVASITAYKGIFKPLGVSGAIETATALRKPSEASEGPISRKAYRASKGLDY